VLLVLAVVVGSFRKVNYVSLSPGYARPSEPLITITGHESYKNPGSVLYVTVDVITKTTAFEAALGWLLPDVDVLPLRDVIGTATPQQDNRLNLLQMSDSKVVAELVALQHLNIPVETHNLGAVVQEVSPGTPASTALEVGDVITAVDGAAVSTEEDLRKALLAHAPGDRVTLSVVRYDPKRPPGTGDVTSPGQSVPVPVTLAARPDKQPGGFLGVVPTNDTRLRFPFNISIDTGSVGGPSAGLAFTLSLIDKLSPGGILHGHKVAVTGEIEPDGTVGDVGGVGQKTVAAHDAGAEVFLVPADEADEARAKARGGLKVVGVRNVGDALRALAQLR
jgi:PDZ domain-containing protein